MSGAHAFLFDMPSMTLDEIRAYSKKMVADLTSAPAMVDVNDRELQAHAIIHYLVSEIDRLMGARRES